MKTHTTNEAAAANADRQTAGAGHAAQLQQSPSAAMVDNSPAALTLQRFQQMANNWPHALQLKRYAEMAAASPAALTLQRFQHMANNSPQALQLQRYAEMAASTAGAAVQRVEDEELLQGKFATVQRAEDDKLLQRKFEPVQRQEEDELLQGKFETVQRAEDEELLQGKFDTIQRMDEEDPFQGKFDALQRKEDHTPLQGRFEQTAASVAPAVAPAAVPVQREEKPNNTGLPNQLKSGIESLAGMSIDHVKVHYNSDKPAQLQAHAYAQGSEIHVGPGQERHLPHEAWHVVQQAQRRVKPTVQMKGGVAVNDDVGLEGEADLMGARALGVGQLAERENVGMVELSPSSMTHSSRQLADASSRVNMPAQLKTSVTWTEQNFEYNDATTCKLTSEPVGKRMVADLDPKDINNFDGNSTTSKETPDLFNGLKKHWDPGTKYWVRGHLLNDHVHGPNTFPNIFPISGHANGDHLNLVESHIKNWLRLPTVGPNIRYEVDATQDSGSVAGLRNASGSFYCYAHMVDTKEKRHAISRTIRSLPQVKTPPASGAVSYSGNTVHANNWWYYNDTERLNGNTSNQGLRVSKGMDENGRLHWTQINKKSGWSGSPYYHVTI